MPYEPMRFEIKYNWYGDTFETSTTAYDENGDVVWHTTDYDYEL